jgi:hypothetical protein
MAIVDRIEDLVFQSKSFSSIEIVKDTQVIVRMRCIIEKLTDDSVQLLSAAGIRYQIHGKKLQVREYGDTYVKVIGNKVRNVEIVGDGDE